VPSDAVGRRTRQESYYDCAVGITGAQAGLADSGSVVVASGHGRSRMASLIPSLHIALLRRDRLWPSLAHWIHARPDALGTEANWTVITGPSRTADIEQVLTLGVHGPREVHVLLV
jgi:L-lactate dehydrogenase complex protein LldG